MKVSEFTIEPVHKKAVTPFIEKWHYSHYAGGIQHRQCFALYSPDGKFGLPNKVNDKTDGDVLALMSLRAKDFGDVFRKAKYFS